MIGDAGPDYIKNTYNPLMCSNLHEISVYISVDVFSALGAVALLLVAPEAAQIEKVHQLDQGSESR